VAEMHRHLPNLIPKPPPLQRAPEAAVLLTASSGQHPISRGPQNIGTGLPRRIPRRRGRCNPRRPVIQPV